MKDLDKKREAVIIPGSYDPVTVGHLEVIKKAAEQYERVYAVIFVNPEKKYLFELSDRVRMLMLACEEFDNVLVSESAGLVIDYMREHGIEKIVKGYRNAEDLEYERKMAKWNLEHSGYETELWKADAAFADVSSTRVRGELAEGRIPTELLPPAVAEYIEALGASDR